MTPSGVGLAAIRRHAPPPSFPTARPSSRKRGRLLCDSGCPIGLVGALSAGS